jgi:hypothetical protein
MTKPEPRCRQHAWGPWRDAALGRFRVCYGCGVYAFRRNEKADAPPPFKDDDE